MFSDDLLSVIVHWQDEHPSENLWFIDYGPMVLALCYPQYRDWPLTKASAIRRYFPEESMMADTETDDEEILSMLDKLSKWVSKRQEFQGKGFHTKQAVVFEVEEEGFSYSIFEFRTLH